jgi:hypothetical protein
LLDRHFENFGILIPYLQSINKYSIGIPKPVKSQIKNTDDDCVRASIFTFGTYIMLKRYGGIFSQLVQFLYFYVQYLKVNNIRLEDREQKKKNILGTEKCIYKKQGDRKEYLRHKGKLITVKEYRKIKANK